VTYSYAVPGKKEKLPLSVTHPELAKEADGWDPSNVSSDSGQRVRWKCCNSHTWTAALNYRVKRRSKCPYCINQKVWVGFNDFATTHPELLTELLSSDGKDFVAGSSTKDVEWLCPKGHKYVAKPVYRTVRKQGCPVCAGKKVVAGFNDLSSTHPELAKEAFDFDPQKLSSGSHKIVKWKCPKGHIFSSVLKQRTTGKKSNCSVCSGDQVMPGVNDIATTHPELADESLNWDPTKYSAGHNKKLGWTCPLGHTWEASPNTRTNLKSGCPTCNGNKILRGFNDLMTLFPALIPEVSGWDPSEISPGTHKKYEWICSKNHKWLASPHERTRKQSRGCPSCSKFGFIPTDDGYLYFLEHPLWEMYQIGITNKPENRLNDHLRRGWEIKDVRGPMDGLVTQEWEVAILRTLKAKGADLSNSKIAGKFDGYSEAWSKSTFEVGSIKELMRLTEEFEEK
jgi:hypothetical protein